MNNWRDHMPVLQPGWNWDIDTGVINYLILQGPGHRDATPISLAPNEFLEPFYNWTSTKDLTVTHLQRTAQRLLRNMDRKAANIAAEKKWK